MRCEILSLADYERNKKEYQLINSLLEEINCYMLQNLDRAEEETRVTSLPLDEPLKTFTLQTLRLSSVLDKRIAIILEAAREKKKEKKLVAVRRVLLNERLRILRLDDKFRANTVKELLKIDHRKAKDIRQKSRSRWALEDDENSSFFHGIINSNENRSRINGLNIQWVKVVEPVLIKNHIYHSFKSKYDGDVLNRPSFTSSSFKHLLIEDSNSLDQPFTTQEIKDVVWSCGGSKAPGPDGFTFKLLKKQWDLFSTKIVSYINACISSTFTSVLVNGSPTSEFKLEKGLRQGDHLSPLLFIIAVEALNVILIDAKSKHLFRGIDVGKDKRGDGPYIGPQLESIGLHTSSGGPKLESLIYNLQITSNHDNWECLIDPSRNFTVKGMRNAITNTLMPSNPSLTRWNKLVPIKVNIASWRIENRRIPTQVNLDLRGIDLHSVRCSNCDEDLEIEEHLLVNCTLAKNTWLEIIKWWNIRDVHMDNLNDVFSLKNHANLPPVLSNMLDAVDPMYNRIVNAVSNHDAYFHSNTDCTGREDISSLIKCTYAIRQLAYGVNASFLDEYVHISERSSCKAIGHFFQAVMEIYGHGYFRKPMVTDIKKLYRHHEEKHGFLGIRDHGSNPFILLEAITSQDLWIWHAFFGVVGLNNDINVLYQSPLFNDLKTGRAPEIPFVDNGVTYQSRYYFVDEIYSEFAPLVKTISEPADDEHKIILYKKKQESERKYVE
nr:hypothetical protein [Tanacetum cinerariifolium]